LDPLYRAIDATTSYLDEARDSEARVPFAERLVRLREQERGDKITVKREDLHALHQALHVAAGHVNDDLIRGSDSRAIFIGRLARIRKAAFDAIWDHDDVSKQERFYG
jgi:hypothetical protein